MHHSKMIFFLGNSLVVAMISIPDIKDKMRRMVKLKRNRTDKLNFISIKI
jgi:hypothetical protein